MKRITFEQGKAVKVEGEFTAEDFIELIIENEQFFDIAREAVKATYDKILSGRDERGEIEESRFVVSDRGECSFIGFTEPIVEQMVKMSDENHDIRMLLLEAAHKSVILWGMKNKGMSPDEVEKASFAILEAYATLAPEPHMSFFREAIKIIKDLD